MKATPLAILAGGAAYAVAIASASSVPSAFSDSTEGGASRLQTAAAPSVTVARGWDPVASMTPRTGRAGETRGSGPARSLAVASSASATALGVRGQDAPPAAKCDAAGTRPAIDDLAACAQQSAKMERRVRSGPDGRERPGGAVRQDLWRDHWPSRTSEAEMEAGDVAAGLSGPMRPIPLPRRKPTPPHDPAHGAAVVMFEPPPPRPARAGASGRTSDPPGGDLEGQPLSDITERHRAARDRERALGTDLVETGETVAAVGSRARSENGGRITLSAAQMDAVTAGLAAIEVTASAFAAGRGALTGAETRTVARPLNEFFEIAYGTGHAIAAGDIAGVHVATELDGDGGVVFGGKYTFTLQVPGVAQGHTGGFVGSVDPDHPRFEMVQWWAEILGWRLEHDYRNLQHMSEVGRRLAKYDPEVGDAFLERTIRQNLDRLQRNLDHGLRTLIRLGESQPLR